MFLFAVIYCMADASTRRLCIGFPFLFPVDCRHTVDRYRLSSPHVFPSALKIFFLLRPVSCLSAIDDIDVVSTSIDPFQRRLSSGFLLLFQSPVYNRLFPTDHPANLHRRRPVGRNLSLQSLPQSSTVLVVKSWSWFGSN